MSLSTACNTAAHVLYRPGFEQQLHAQLFNMKYNADEITSIMDYVLSMNCLNAYKPDAAMLDVAGQMDKIKTEFDLSEAHVRRHCLNNPRLLVQNIVDGYDDLQKTIRLSQIVTTAPKAP